MHSTKDGVECREYQHRLCISPNITSREPLEPYASTGGFDAHGLDRTMELSFATKKLRAQCLESGVAEKVYGPVVAAAIRARLADLDAAVTLADLPRADSLDLSEREIRISLARGWDLVCEAGTPHQDQPLDWARVYRLKLLRIEEP